MIKDKKILITGGGGFLGFGIVKELLNNNTIISISRNHYKKLEHPNITQIQGDIKDKKLTNSLIKKSDLIFHTAAKAGIWGKYKDYFETNVIGSQNISNSCLKYNKPLVYTSSPSVVFDGSDMENVDEKVPYPKNFKSHYSKTKAIAEKYIIQKSKEGLNSIILRPHLIWGPFDNHLVPRILKKANRLFKIGNKKCLIDTIYIDNAVYGHILAGKKILENNKLSGSVFFLSQDEPIYIWDIVNGILKAGGKSEVKRKIPYFLAYTLSILIESLYTIFMIKKEPPLTRFLVSELSTSHFFNIEEAKKKLNYKPKISIKEGLKILEKSLRK